VSLDKEKQSLFKLDTQRSLWRQKIKKKRNSETMKKPKITDYITSLCAAWEGKTKWCPVTHAA
jgi:hypothetical protein